ncbi:hypothetical protein TNCV_1715721 [Trichonephila clavipes]|nr:hypothetical protein TNCV_1715721 [Trichonephila clavipes]
MSSNLVPLKTRCVGGGNAQGSNVPPRWYGEEARREDASSDSAFCKSKHPQRNDWLSDFPRTTEITFEMRRHPQIQIIHFPCTLFRRAPFLNINKRAVPHITLFGPKVIERSPLILNVSPSASSLVPPQTRQMHDDVFAVALRFAHALSSKPPVATQYKPVFLHWSAVLQRSYVLDDFHMLFSVAPKMMLLTARIQ